MLDTVDTRQLRHDATRSRIIEAAWRLARRDGLAALSFREVAREVGMRAPSLYTYFDSKNALYDALYVEAVRALGSALAERPIGATPQETLRNRMRIFIAFSCADPVRYQIIAQRPVPGFEPTPESFDVAKEVMAGVRADLEAAGVRGERALDLWRALQNGLIAQQIANEPGGTRWTRLADEAADMFLAHHAKKRRQRASDRRKR